MMIVLEVVSTENDKEYDENFDYVSIQQQRVNHNRG